MKKMFVVTASLFFLGISITHPAIGAVKAGSSCSKAGIKSVSAGKTYTCVKSGKKLVWNKSALIPVAKPAPSVTPSEAPAPTPIPTKSAEPVVVKVDYTKTFSTDQGYYTDFEGPCQMDQDLKGRAAEIQTYFFNLNRCAGQMRVNKYSLGSARPASSFDSKSQFSNTDPCKLVTPQSSRSGLGFTTTQPGRNEWANARRHPSPNTVVQLVPIYSNDSAQPKGSPSDDYQFFLDYLKNWIEYSSDFGSNVEIRIPDQYIKMDKNIADYKILHTNNHDNPGHQAFNKDVVAAVDLKIDFKGAHIAIVVPPAGTEASVLGQGAIAGLQTQEGLVPIGITEYAAFAANPSKSTYTNLSHPFWWIHELFHGGFGLDDHYGDTQQNINTEYGMGWLTMMTPFGGDLTTWEKWVLGFMKDSQIQCVSDVRSSTHWIAPSSVKTDESKAVIIRISDSKAIIVETLRPAGLYYKLPKQSQGALVYELDLTKDSHGFGMKLSLPLGRNVNSNPFFMASYPLKSGDSTITNGYQITILESGTFGDVVKVEKL
jgi:M6 family metalloprotease-like protein